MASLTVKLSHEIGVAFGRTSVIVVVNAAGVIVIVESLPAFVLVRAGNNSGPWPSVVHVGVAVARVVLA